MKKILLLIIIFMIVIGLSGCVRKSDDYDIVDNPVISVPDIISEETEELFNEVPDVETVEQVIPDYMLELLELPYQEQLNYWNAAAEAFVNGYEVDYYIIDNQSIITYPQNK